MSQGVLPVLSSYVKIYEQIALRIDVLFVVETLRTKEGLHAEEEFLRKLTFSDPCDEDGLISRAAAKSGLPCDKITQLNIEVTEADERSRIDKAVHLLRTWTFE